MEVSCQLHDPATLPPGKDPPATHSAEDCVDHSSGLDGVENRKKIPSLPLPRIEPGREIRNLVTVLLMLLL